MSAEQFSDLTVILPTLNEAGNLESLIEGLGRELPGCQVIVVDDNSSDGTPDLVRTLAAQNASLRLIARQVTPPCLTD